MRRTANLNCRQHCQLAALCSLFRSYGGHCVSPKTPDCSSRSLGSALRCQCSIFDYITGPHFADAIAPTPCHASWPCHASQSCGPRRHHGSPCQSQNTTDLAKGCRRLDCEFSTDRSSAPTYFDICPLDL